MAADAEAAAERGAALIAETAAAAIAERQAFTFAVSGGRGPWRMFELLGAQRLDWPRIEIFQVDERVAPDRNPDRNLTHLLESLPEAAHESLRPMPVGEAELEAAAGEYAVALPDRLDLVHLGLGPDGHTASLIPDDPVLEIADCRVAVTGEYQGRRRMTLTFPALAAARRILWLVTGADKREPLAKVRRGDRSIPAGRVDATKAIVICDRAAAPEDRTAGSNGR